MDRPSAAVERVRLIVTIVLRIIAAAALLRGLWMAGIWIAWGLSRQDLFSNVYLQTWIYLGLSVVLGGGILVNLDWLTRALVPEVVMFRISSDEIQHDTHGEMAAAITLAVVRFAGGGLIVYGLWMLGASIPALIPSSQSPPQKVSWIIAGYVAPIAFLVIVGSVVIVADRRLALWLRSPPLPGTGSAGDGSS